MVSSSRLKRKRKKKADRITIESCTWSEEDHCSCGCSKRYNVPASVLMIRQRAGGTNQADRRAWMQPRIKQGSRPSSHRKYYLDKPHLLETSGYYSRLNPTPDDLESVCSRTFHWVAGVSKHGTSRVHTARRERFHLSTAPRYVEVLSWLQFLSEFYQLR